MPTNRQLFLQHLAQTSTIPLSLEIERAEGCWLYDVSGKKYLDLISGIAVSSLGHRHAKVLKAIEEQLQKYLHLMVYGEFIQSAQVGFAELLVKNLPENLNSVYFTNSGAEATEGAMKLAKRATGRKEFISCFNAYHGSTQGALSLAGDEWLKSAFYPLLPGIKQIKYNNFIDIEQITEKTAAVFIEPLQAEAGALVAQNGYLQAIRKRCTETGTLLVLDEIQTAFGRTGSLFAFEQEQIVPDILLLGKALGGGMPLGAFIADRKLMELLTNNPVLGHITTFGGHPVSCAAAKAAFETLIQENIIDEVIKKEQLFKQKLQHRKIVKVNGKGLLLALELKDFDEVQKVIDYCITEGVITDWFLFNNYSVRIAPPLIISEEEINFACNVILKAVETL